MTQLGFHPAQALSVGGAEGVDLGFAYRAREFGVGLGQQMGQQGADAAVEALGQQDQAFQEVRLDMGARLRIGGAG